MASRKAGGVSGRTRRFRLGLGGGVAHALEPVKISREDTALDLTADDGDLQRQRRCLSGFDPLPHGRASVRRIEVRSSTENHQGDWAVFALANVRKSSSNAYRRTAFPLVEFEALLARTSARSEYSRSRRARVFALDRQTERRKRTSSGITSTGCGHHFRCRTHHAGVAADLSLAAGRLQGYGQRLHPLPRYRCSALPGCSRCS